MDLDLAKLTNNLFRLRFADQNIEHDYLAYTLPRRNRSVRTGSWASLTAWALFIFTYALLHPESLWWVFLISAGSFGFLSVISVILSYRAGREALVENLAALTNALSGLTVVAITGFIAPEYDLMTVLVVLLVFFLHLICRVTFLRANIATLSYVLPCLFVLASNAWGSGTPLVLTTVLCFPGWILATIGGRSLELLEREGFLLHHQLAATNQKLLVKSATDSLTGLCNRGAFFEHLEAMSWHCRNFGTLFVVAMVDVDHFKSINDQWGHPTGDAVLKDLAQLLRNSFRDGDLAARYGGEEFIVIMRTPNLPLALGALERFRIQVQTHAFPGVPRPITCSIGVALAEPPESPQDLVNRADQKLYQAKHGGRNCIRS